MASRMLDLMSIVDFPDSPVPSRSSFILCKWLLFFSSRSICLDRQNCSQSENRKSKINLWDMARDRCSQIPCIHGIVDSDIVLLENDIISLENLAIRNTWTELNFLTTINRQTKKNKLKT
ncbi:hypothetical protein BpHYR1_025138 [Brachionus plicatilis]|uniref:Uncharacterized protein n=1 Tax=Brachionus plicatilis TaxID=10195 RepID=A0A3M7RRV4_BRAPC|nr:hypothetical protein BpHYR1_025138 [Brachionus plicatilis]